MRYVTLSLFRHIHVAIEICLTTNILQGVDIQYMARSQMREGPICSTTSKLIFVSSTQTK